MLRKTFAAAVLVALQSAAAFCFAEDNVKYRVKLSGVRSTTLRGELLAEADTLRLRKSPPRSMLQLQRRIDRDVLRFNEILRSHGYYAAVISSTVDSHRFRRRRVLFNISKGPRYHIGRVVITPVDDNARGLVVFSDIAGLIPGVAAVSSEIVQGGRQIATHLQESGYPFAGVVIKEVLVDHAAHSVDIDYGLTAGPQAVFGAFEITGLERVREAYVRARVQWPAGGLFNSRRISATRQVLADSGLFSVLRFSHAEQLNDDGSLPIQLELRERMQRAIAIGVGYHSDDGARAALSWENRNLRGGGELLSFSVNVSEYSYSASSRLRIPGIMRPDRSTTFRIQGGVEDPEAYESRNLAAQALLETVDSRNWKWGRGIGIKYADVRDSEGSEHYNLLYIPLLLNGETVTDPLDPQRGRRWYINTAPYVDTLDSSITFLKSRIGLTQYQRILRRPFVVGAVRLTAGTIGGAGHSMIPADERFYAGGGGSVRGYAFQFVGPLNEDGKPRGGRSFGLLSAEMRWRLGGNWGLVAFADGGMVDVGSIPFAGDKLFRGTGGGIRYFTPIGPLRVDAAVPLDRRSGVDDDYQVYVSLGQAF